MVVAAPSWSEEDTFVGDRGKAPSAPRENGFTLGTSVGKALAVLDAFRGGGALLGVSQIADRAHIPKSTAHRLLSVLVDHGYVDRVDSRYQLGRAAFELGNMVAECRPRNLRSVAIPYMTDLYRTYDATVHLAVLDGTDVLYVEKIYGHNGVDLPSRIGGRVPALCTALGKAILAFSDNETMGRALSGGVPRLTVKTMTNPSILRSSLIRARETGVAHDNEGSSLGVYCIAAPILRRSSAEVLGAISMSFLLTEKLAPAIEARLSRAATAISAKCS
jgi:DNA-binding IclR family transcriptional regulator